MFDSIAERVSQRLPSAYAIQFTNGTHDEYTSLIHDTYPGPFVEVDCAAIEDYDDFLDAIADETTTDPSDSLSSHYFINQHFLNEGGSLVLYNFHELDDETTSDIAMYIKGLWEDISFDGWQDFGIAITTDDTGAVFVGNGDLSGRVLSIDLSDDA